MELAADLHRVHIARPRDRLVDGHAGPLDDRLPERQSEPSEGQLATAAELAGDDRVPMDAPRDERVERLRCRRSRGARGT